MIFRLHFESDADAEAAASELKSLGGAAVRLLSECVEHQQVHRKAASKLARSLESAGFIFIREAGSILDPTQTLSPSLAGEEALAALESMRTGVKTT